jgi:hypothetical protein
MVGTAHTNRQTLAKLLVVAVGMFGFGFALVPFYRALCDAVGLNNVLKSDGADVVAATAVDTTRLLTVQFDTNLRSDLPWTFTPVEKSVRIHPGELTLVTFEIRNQTSNTVVVTRSFANCTARNPLDNGTAPWMDYNGVTNQASMVVHQGVRLFITTNALASLPGFAGAKDSDKDRHSFFADKDAVDLHVGILAVD